MDHHSGCKLLGVCVLKLLGGQTCGYVTVVRLALTFARPFFAVWSIQVKVAESEKGSSSID